MIRGAVTLYLALVTLAGPWFCCCTSAQVGSWLTALVRSDGQTPVRACCHGHHHDGHEHPAPAGDEPSAPEPPTCPCQEDGSREPAALVSAAEPAKIAQLHLAVVAAWDAHALPAAAVPPAADHALRGPSECGAFPHMTAREILRALQSYRC